jgi:hypothetical protein
VPRDPSNKLSQHIQGLIAINTVSKSDVKEIFRLCRLVLEHDKKKPSYPTLSLYCDWLQHNFLDHNSVALNVLYRLAVVKKTYEDDTGKFINAVSGVFGLKELRREMIALFQVKGIQFESLLCSISKWEFIGNTLLDALAGVPIAIPKLPTRRKKPYKDIVERMLPLSAGHGRIPYAVEIVDRTRKAEEPGRPAGYYWQIRLDPPEAPFSAFLDGHLQGTESKLAFLLP